MIAAALTVAAIAVAAVWIRHAKAHTRGNPPAGVVVGPHQEVRDHDLVERMRQSGTPVLDHAGDLDAFIAAGPTPETDHLFEVLGSPAVNDATPFPETDR